MEFIIPFRLREGGDPLRLQNLEASKRWVESLNLGPVRVVDDGRSGDAQFNRSAAYNRGWQSSDADVFVFYESDLLVPREQVVEGARLASENIGLVVPFSRFMSLEPDDSVKVRAGAIHPSEAKSEQVRGEKKSIGAVNIVSRETLNLIGQFDPSFEGAWFDDDSMEIAFRVCCGPTRFIDGPGWHMYHLPGANSDHLSDEDRAATGRNRQRWLKYRRARTPEQIRRLTCG